jgi:hypothetical protein
VRVHQSLRPTTLTDEIAWTKGVVTMGMKKFDKDTRNKLVVVLLTVLLSLTIVAGTLVEFIVVVSYIDKIDAVVTIVEDHLVISLAGGCAFYVVLFILMKRVVKDFVLVLMSPGD